LRHRKKKEYGAGQKIRPTRLHSNLRPTTRECVYLVSRGHFRSRDKDGGHIIRSARPPYAKTQCCSQTSWLYVL